MSKDVRSGKSTFDYDRRLSDRSESSLSRLVKGSDYVFDFES